MTPQKKLEKLKSIYETIEIHKSGITVTTHAGYNLAGAIIDLEKAKADKITLQTLRRVRNQLAQMAKVLGI